MVSSLHRKYLSCAHTPVEQTMLHEVLLEILAVSSRTREARQTLAVA